jgi:hypothetical protein
MILGIQAIWLAMTPKVFFGAVLVFAIAVYALRASERWEGFRQVVTLKRLLIATIVFRIAYAALLTTLQYFSWAAGGLGALFLKESLDASLPIPFVHSLPWIFGSRFGYFIFYSILHFWINVVLSIFIAWLFYRFLILLKRHKERFFDVEETELGFLLALVVGWPTVTVFVPLIFLFVVIASLTRLIVFKEAYTTLGWPFILAATATLLFGDFLLIATGLSVLSV